MAGEKTEKATPRKLEDERKKGNIFQGRDITIALNLLITFVSLKLLSNYMYAFFEHVMVYFVSGSDDVKYINSDNISQIMMEIVICILVLVLPLLLISALSSFLISGAQTKFIFNTKKIAFKMSHLNPLSGFKRTFSIRALVQLVKSILMLVIISVVIYNGIIGFTDSLPSFYSMTAPQSIIFIASSFYSIAIKACFVILMIGILDYFFQWWQYGKDIRMTKQEVKDEYKTMEGDPNLKSAIKNRQQKLANMRTMKKVPEADVIIVNPEHFAVALKYDAKKHKAPVVIAKGKDYLALKIKEIAAENNIRIEENPPLARALYKAVDIDKEIPPEYYQAVAEVLSYIYSKKKNK